MGGNLRKIGLLLLTVFFACVTSASAATAYGVTSANQLIRFDTATPANVTTIGAITGLQAGENILGIDFRPANGQLYALGSTSRLYVVNTTNAAALAVSPLQFTTTLSGTDFGFDFNPTVDRIRVVSNAGQNLRLNPDTGGIAAVDGNINPGSPSVSAAAYTNNYGGATATTLYVIDTSTSPDTLYVQNPPNNGTLATPVAITGIDATNTNGFDIDSGTNTAFAALTVGGAANLYTINLTTGAATNVGAIGGNPTLRGLAIEIAAVPGLTVYGVTTANQLVRFNSARPGSILSTSAITGLQTGENVLGIDFRPATGQLFALGSTSRLYTINTSTAAATQIGAAGAFTLNGTDFGFDFNPTVDRIRVVSNTGQNLRLNPNDGTLTATDGTLNPGTPNIVGAAYTNNFAGAATTTLYDIDSNSDRLLTQNPPNNGTLVDVGALGVNTTSNVGFDISAGQGAAMASLQVQGDTASKLFAINLATGAASFVGQIGGSSGVLLRDIAIINGRGQVDYDGDHRTDFAVFRPSNNTYYALRSSNNSLFAQSFGLAESDVPTPADFDGDGRTDLAVFRTSGANGVFFVQNSSNNSFQAVQFGLSTDEPVVRDYDGDGRADFAVVRRENGQLFWYINNSSNNSFRAEQFGLSSDVVAPGDYDGDGKFDLAVRRSDNSNNATFYIQQSTAGFRGIQFGFASDIIVPGDYDGDGRTDVAVVRPGTNYNWYILQSATNTLRAVQLGTKPHVTAQGDYDGDGRTDVAVWNPTNGTFYVIRFNGGLITQQFGQSSDVPVAFYDSF